MSDIDLPATMHYVDRCIEAYAGRCRGRIPTFADRHFSFEQTWAMQRPTLWRDLLLAPLNSAWSIPYVAIKKTCKGLEGLGVPAASRLLLYLPSGIKTGYQQKVELLISSELLEWDLDHDSAGVPHGLVQEFKEQSLLPYVTLHDEPDSARSLRAVVEGFSSGGVFVANAVATLLTIALGWLVLGSLSGGLFDVADRLARRNAHERAAARFFLGRRIGSGFYTIFKPAASRTETVIILIGLAAAIAVIAMACTIVSDPIRKIVGLHQHRLSALLDNIERELLLVSKKRIKRSLIRSAS